MDPEAQLRLKKLVEDGDRDDFVVLLGSPEDESSEMYAETVMVGDPAYAGALAGVELKLPAYHVLEPEIEAQVPEEVWEQEISMMAMVLDRDTICDVMRQAREQWG